MLHQYEQSHQQGGNQCKLLVPLFLKAQIKHEEVGSMA